MNLVEGGIQEREGTLGRREKRETHGQPVKQVISTCFIFHEEMDIPEDLLVDRDTVVVANGVNTQEVELYDTLLAIHFFMQF